jgi:pilus assembly protein CpaF
MFGKRTEGAPPPAPAAAPAPPPPPAAAPAAPTPSAAPKPPEAPKPAAAKPAGGHGTGHGSKEAPAPVAEKAAANPRMDRARKRIWADLRDGIDLKSLSRMDAEAARNEITSAVQEIGQFRGLDVTPAELQQIAKEAADDMLGFGPLEELLAMDGIADIMINGPKTIYIELKGKIQVAPIEFRDNQHLLTICQRIVGVIGRRVDESSPICDARLPDGSRVNVIIPPLAIDGCCMTIRKFTKEKLTLEKLLEFKAMTPACMEMIKIIGACRANTLVSGGTGSGKTTMLNCLTRYMEAGERVITCEDAAELQLQQPHVVRLETRPPNLEGVGEVKMRDLIKNCLRMRPDRIIVGEVRGPEAFDLLQAMNTGHDGSMGTVHANNPREALTRMENMIAMGGLNLPSAAVREQIASAVNVIIQVQRLRDGSRKVTHITEITGMEGEVVTMQDLFRFEYEGEDEFGRIIGKQKSSGLRPILFERARMYNLEKKLLDVMAEAYQ